MDFLKKSRTYMVQHTKEQAVEQLKQDVRVDTIKVRRHFMFIKTKPLRTDKSFYPELDLKPTGTYLITLKYSHKYNRLEIKMIRQEGGVSNIQSPNRHHLHIDGANVYDKICFGSAHYEIVKIKEHKDWYWAGVMCLNLLEDFTDHNMATVRAIEHLVVSQIKFAKDKKFEKYIRKKTATIIRKDRRLMGEFNLEYNHYFIKFKEEQNG